MTTQASTQPSQIPLSILLVEDSIPYAKLVMAKLKHGLTMRHEIQHVDCAHKGVEAIGRNRFDLIILDMHLPDTSGIETFQTIHPAASNTPIVILSSDDDEQLAIDAVMQGAQDYLIKGEDDDHTLMRSIRFAIERKKRLHAEGELQAARRIQQSLLPESPPVMKGYDLHGAMFPAVETAGDYFDFILPLVAIGEDVIGIAVGDVSGHGLGPAMVIAETRGCLRSFAMLEPDLARMLALTNEILVRNRNSHFVTLLLGYIDQATRIFHFASAGHPAWHLSAAGKTSQLPGTGLPLGIQSGASWETHKTQPLGVGDFLLIMTDGITEATSESGELFGNQRLIEFVRSHKEESAEEIVKLLHEHLGQFSSGKPQLDDMTMVIIKVVE